jgi:hypothetical protein
MAGGPQAPSIIDHWLKAKARAVPMSDPAKYSSRIALTVLNLRHHMVAMAAKK